MGKHRESAAWRELYRCDDLIKARAVATSIAAMEFDVRLSDALRAGGGRRGGSSVHDAFLEDGQRDEAPALGSPDFADDFEGPYRIEVPEAHFGQLADVLGEIISEQEEFDQWIEFRRQRLQTRVFVLLTVAGVVEVLAVMKWVDV